MTEGRGNDGFVVKELGFFFSFSLPANFTETYIYNSGFYV